MADSSNAPFLPPEPTPRQRRLPGSALRRNLSLQIKTITPVMGGATQTRHVDECEVLRVPSIRGALRFWWRALYGYQLPNPQELAQAEARIWGRAGDDSGSRSGIDICLDIIKPTEPGQWIETSDINMSGPDAYALWPARGNPRNNIANAQRFRPGIVFSLSLRVPLDIEDQVVCTLRAWLLFGGYGSRTRRGCGSFGVEGPNSQQWLPNSLSVGELARLFGDIPLFGSKKHAQATDMPMLQGASLFYGNTESAPLNAWHKALHWLRDFRQNIGIARESGPDPKRGRSYWPEPDKIRYLVCKPPYAHPPRREYGKAPVWPRASFGLPIIGQFQQKDRRGVFYAHGDNPGYEPDPFELVWRDNISGSKPHERLASPLILKPLALANGQSIPIALWLNRAYPQYAQVVLRQRGHVIAGSGAALDAQSIAFHTAKQAFDVIAGSGAAFDALTAHNEGTAFEPLRGKSSMRQAFGDWLKTYKKLKELA